MSLDEDTHVEAASCWCQPREVEPGVYVHRDLLERLVGSA